MRCGFLIIKAQTALHHAMLCTVTCSAVMPFCKQFWCDFCSLVNTHAYGLLDFMGRFVMTIVDCWVL